MAYNPANTPKSALKDLQDVLINLYNASLELFANSSKLFSKNTAAQTIHTILLPGKTEALVSKLTKLETKLSYKIQTYETGWNVTSDERLTGLLHCFDILLTRIDEHIDTLFEKADKRKQFEILK